MCHQNRDKLQKGIKQNLELKNNNKWKFTREALQIWQANETIGKHEEEVRCVCLVWIPEKMKKSEQSKPVVVVHTCSPSYLGA